MSVKLLSVLSLTYLSFSLTFTIFCLSFFLSNFYVSFFGRKIVRKIFFLFSSNIYIILHCVIKQELGLILYVIKVDICSRVNPDHQHAKYPSTKPLYLSPKNHLTPHVLFPPPPPPPPQHGTLGEGNIYKQIVLILFVTQKW